MNGESIEGGEPLQISFARSQSQPPVEWVIAGQPGMIQPTQIGQIAAFGGIVSLAEFPLWFIFYY